MAKHLKLLLATDLTARCDRPLQRALQLSAQSPASLTALYVNKKVSEKEAAQDEVSLRQSIVEEFPELTDSGKLVIEHGKAPETIARVANELDRDIIVTGVARFNSVGDFVLGTAVDHLVRHSAVPVLVVKRRAQAPYRHLLVATDLSSCSRKALICAAQMFPDAAITLVHAYHVPYESWLKSDSVHSEITTEAQTHLEDFIATLPKELLSRVRTQLNYGEPQAIVCRALRTTKADLLVLGTHGRSGFVHATMGSWAAALLNSAICDVLMVRE